MSLRYLFSIVLLVHGAAAVYAEEGSPPPAEETVLPAAHEEGESRDVKEDEEHEENLEHEKPKIRPKIFSGYGKYRESFRALCWGIYNDGRLDPFVTLLTNHSARDPLCGACRPLFQSFLIGCGSVIRKVAPKKWQPPPKPAELTADALPEVVDKPTPTPLPSPTVGPKAQREPSAAICNLLSNIFIPVSEDEVFIEEHLKAVGVLTYVLRNPENTSEGVKDYFSILAEFIEAPFIPVRRRRESIIEEKGAEHSAPTVNVDTLFEE